MERQVVVMRSRKDGTFILHPMGTFEGYGAYVGMFPYRTALGGSDDCELGDLALDLLDKSGPSNYHIRDIVKYQSESLDEMTREILSKYLPVDRVSESFIARNFIYLDVRHKSGQKTWRIVVHTFDPEKRCLKDGDSIRVKISDGPQALGSAIRATGEQT